MIIWRQKYFKNDNRTAMKTRILTGKAIHKVIGKRHKVLNGVIFYFCYRDCAAIIVFRDNESYTKTGFQNLKFSLLSNSSLICNFIKRFFLSPPVVGIFLQSSTIYTSFITDVICSSQTEYSLFAMTVISRSERGLFKDKASCTTHFTTETGPNSL